MLWELSVLPKNTTQCPRTGLEPGPLDPESSALTTRPPCLPPLFYIPLHKCAIYIRSLTFMWKIVWLDTWLRGSCIVKGLFNTNSRLTYLLLIVSNEPVSSLYTWLIQYFCFLLSFSKKSTKESTAPHLMNGTKDIRSGIAVTSLCLFLTQRKGVVGFKLVESRLTLPWPGFPFFLDWLLCCFTSCDSKTNTIEKKPALSCKLKNLLTKYHF